MCEGSEIPEKGVVPNKKLPVYQIYFKIWLDSSWFKNATDRWSCNVSCIKEQRW